MGMLLRRHYEDAAETKQEAAPAAKKPAEVKATVPQEKAPKKPRKTSEK